MAGIDSFPLLEVDDAGLPEQYELWFVYNADSDSYYKGDGWVNDAGLVYNREQIVGTVRMLQREYVDVWSMIFHFLYVVPLKLDGGGHEYPIWKDSVKVSEFIGVSNAR